MTNIMRGPREALWACVIDVLQIACQTISPGPRLQNLCMLLASDGTAPAGWRRLLQVAAMLKDTHAVAKAICLLEDLTPDATTRAELGAFCARLAARASVAPGSHAERSALHRR